MPVADSTNPRGMTSLPDVRRSRGEDPYPAACHRRNSVPDDYHQVHGWGADLDPVHRPMVPMELPSNVKTVRGHVQHWQKPTHRIHVSNEHPGLTPVFGTSCPPHGLSGKMRDYAFEYGEATGRHWMMLMYADRVDRIESMIGALLRLRPDNFLREKGWIARLTYGQPMRRRRSLLTVGAALAGLAIAYTQPALAGKGMSRLARLR